MSSLPSLRSSTRVARCCIRRSAFGSSLLASFLGCFQAVVGARGRIWDGSFFNNLVSMLITCINTRLPFDDERVAEMSGPLSTSIPGGPMMWFRGRAAARRARRLCFGVRKVPTAHLKGNPWPSGTCASSTSLVSTSSTTFRSSSEGSQGALVDPEASTQDQWRPQA